MTFVGGVCVAVAETRWYGEEDEVIAKVETLRSSRHHPWVTVTVRRVSEKYTRSLGNADAIRKLGTGGVPALYIHVHFC